MTVQTNTEDFTAPAVESTEPQTVQPEPVDAQVVGTLDHATGQVTPVEAKPVETAGPTQEEVDQKVADFKALVDSATTSDAEGERDTATGTLSDALVERVRLAFGQLPTGSTKTSARPQVRAYVDSKLAEAMNAGDMPAARSLYALQNEALVARGGTAQIVKVTDPTEVFVNELTTLWLAPYLKTPPEGVAEDYAQRVDNLGKELLEPARAYAVWFDADEDTRGDEPAVHEVVKAAVKVARGRAARVGRAKSTGGGSTSERAAFTGTKRNVGNHILEAFEGKPVGTAMTIGEITKFESKEYAGDKPSQGAVSARIWAEGGCSVSGIEAYMVPQSSGDPKKGARKVAEPKSA